MRKTGYSRVHHEGTCLSLSGKFFKKQRKRAKVWKSSENGCKLPVELFKKGERDEGIFIWKKRKSGDSAAAGNLLSLEKQFSTRDSTARG